MLATQASAYWGHRIRFKTVSIPIRRLAMPQFHRTAQHEFYAFFMYYRQPLGTQGGTKGMRNASKQTENLFDNGCDISSASHVMCNKTVDL